MWFSFMVIIDWEGDNNMKKVSEEELKNTMGGAYLNRYCYITNDGVHESKVRVAHIYYWGWSSLSKNAAIVSAGKKYDRHIYSKHYNV